MGSDDLSGRKPLLVLVNPKSGPGNALMLFHRYIAPVLCRAGQQYELVVTACAGDALYRMQHETLLTRWSAVVVVSGDGLLFEVLNGLFSRPDYEAALKFPVSIVPAGSGNGLATSIAVASGIHSEFVRNPVVVSCRALTQRCLSPVDLMLVQTADQQVHVGFLSFGWGLLADVDIESERLRSLGEARFTLWSLVRLIKLRKYRGRLHLLPVSDDMHSPQTELSGKGGRITTGKFACDKQLNVEEAAGPRGSSTCGGVETEKMKKCMRLCPRWSDEVDHPDWITLEGEFLQVYASLVSHISVSACLNAGARLADGTLYVHVLRAGLSRYQMLRYLLALDSGTQHLLPFVSVYRVRALRLEPAPRAPGGVCGHVTVDGERVQYGDVKLEVIPAGARVLAAQADPQ